MSKLSAMTRWGIIGCGDVTEVKSGPAFQKATGSALVAVMRRDLSKAQDYARRHGVPRAYTVPMRSSTIPKSTRSTSPRLRPAIVS